MEGNNQENVQNVQEQAVPQAAPQVEQQPVQDPRLIHPEIIGELRKEKIGKPLMVIEMFLLFGIVFAGLPFINSQLNDENSKLYQIIHGKSTVVSNNTTQAVQDTDYVDGSKSNIISTDIKLKYKNIIMKDISLSNNGLKCTIYSNNGVINLDEEDYFFEVLSPEGSRITSFKLTGTIDKAEREILYESTNFNYNAKIGYQGKISIFTDDDYPDVDFPSYSPNINGYASFVCKRKDRTITYMFKNNFLIGIHDKVVVNHTEYDSNEYTILLDESRKKAEALGTSIATAEENDSGFEFTANISYETDEYKIPETIIDYNYYPSNTLAKRIAFAQTSKGYDCE